MKSFSQDSPCPDRVIGIDFNLLRIRIHCFPHSTIIALHRVGKYFRFISVYVYHKSIEMFQIKIYTSLYVMVLSRVHGSVTANNGFWIGWLDLLTPACAISLNHNQLQQLRINDRLRLAPFSFSCLNSRSHSRSSTTPELNCQIRKPTLL
jgi:hypothetical protein